MSASESSLTETLFVQCPTAASSKKALVGKGSADSAGWDLRVELHHLNRVTLRWRSLRHCNTRRGILLAMDLLVLHLSIEHLWNIARKERLQVR